MEGVWCGIVSGGRIGIEASKVITFLVEGFARGG